MSTSDLMSFYGPSLLKGLAVAGLSGAIVAKFMLGTADAEAAGGKKVFGRAGPSFTRLTLQKVQVENHNTKRLNFKLADQGDISGLPLTSALLTASWPTGQTFPVLRPYTPISSSTQPGSIDFLVKKYPNGKQSTHLHSLAVGDSLLFAVVIPGYKWTPNMHDSVTLIAGGAGITPCYQLIQGILSNPEDRTKVRLIFGVTAEEDVLLRREFEKLERKYGGDRFQAVYAITKGGPSVDGKRFRKGYVTEALIREVACPPTEKNTKVMVCGPPAMEEALVGTKPWGIGVAREGGSLYQLGYSKTQIHQF